VLERRRDVVDHLAHPHQVGGTGVLKADQPGHEECMGRDVQWEWAWVIAELLAHQQAIDEDLDALLTRWDAGEYTIDVAERIAELSDASDALAWARGDFQLE
jgi:hypothetical protein